MATQNIPHRISNGNQAQARREEALRIAQERLAAHQAAEGHIIRATVYQTSNPGPDFTPRAWR